MKYFALIYDVVDDYITRRTEFREEHLKLANDALQQGDLFLGGAFSDPPDQALLIFRGETSAAVEAFVQADPYVKNGLVKTWKIRLWTVVIGN